MKALKPLALATALLALQGCATPMDLATKVMEDAAADQTAMISVYTNPAYLDENGLLRAPGMILSLERTEREMIDTSGSTAGGALEAFGGTAGMLGTLAGAAYDLTKEKKKMVLITAHLKMDSGEMLRLPQTGEPEESFAPGDQIYLVSNKPLGESGSEVYLIRR